MFQYPKAQWMNQSYSKLLQAEYKRLWFKLEIYYMILLITTGSEIALKNLVERCRKNVKNVSSTHKT